MIAVRKRTIESAPTSPTERASDDLTMEMISTVTRAKIGRVRANFVRFDSDLP